MPLKVAKVHAPALPPKSRGGRSKQAKRIAECGDYEGTLWSRVEWYRGLPIEAVPRTMEDERKDPMGPNVRYMVRKHYHMVTYAIDSVVTREASELRTQREDTLLTRDVHIGFRGASKLRSVKLIEKVRRAPPAWWLGLDVWREHIAVLSQAGNEALVEWLRTYKPAP